MQSQEGQQAIQKPNKGRRSEDSGVPSFLKKTYSILEKEEYKDIMCWSDDGTSILIKKPNEFATNILPAYFKHNNLTSYIRQLNMYSFKKRRSGENEYVFSHELFQRNKKELLCKIKRKKPESLSQLTCNKPKVEETESSNPDSLLAENNLLKKLHADLTNKIASLGQKVAELSNVNFNLNSQIRFLVGVSSRTPNMESSNQLALPDSIVRAVQQRNALPLSFQAEAREPTQIQTENRSPQSLLDGTLSYELLINKINRGNMAYNINRNRALLENQMNFLLMNKY